MGYFGSFLAGGACPYLSGRRRGFLATGLGAIRHSLSVCDIRYRRRPGHRGPLRHRGLFDRSRACCRLDLLQLLFPAWVAYESHPLAVRRPDVGVRENAVRNRRPVPAGCVRNRQLPPAHWALHKQESCAVDVSGAIGNWPETAFGETTIRAEQTAENLHTARLRLPDRDVWGASTGADRGTGVFRPVNWLPRFADLVVPRSFRPILAIPHKLDLR
jgi:hypothetical protein